MKRRVLTIGLTFLVLNLTYGEGPKTFFDYYYTDKEGRGGEKNYPFPTERPTIPDLPDIPVIPTIPELPDIPIRPELPELPSIPIRPELPELPIAPERPDPYNNIWINGKPLPNTHYYINNENINVIGREIGIRAIGEDTEVVNDGIITVYPGGGAMHLSEGALGRNEGKIYLKGNNSYGIAATGSTSSAINNGDILMTGEGQYGMVAIGKGSRGINNGKINVEGDFSNGMAVRDGYIENNGEINVYGNYSAGMLAADGGTAINKGNIIISNVIEGTDGMVGYTGSSIINEGSIVGENATGMRGSNPLNKGTIEIRNGYGMMVENGTGVNDGTITHSGYGSAAYTYSGTTFINNGSINVEKKESAFKGDGTFVNNGTINSAGSVNGSSMGNFIIDNDSSISASSITGEFIVESDNTLGSNSDQYSLSGAFHTNDFSGSVNSASYLFDSEVVEKGEGNYDVILERRSFEDITSAEYGDLGSILESNYSSATSVQNNIYDDLKGVSSGSSYNEALRSIRGSEYYASIPKQALDTAKYMDSVIYQKVLDSGYIDDTRYFVGGSLTNTSAEGYKNIADYDTGIYSIHLAADNKITSRSRLGISLGYGHSTSDYSDSASKVESDNISAGGYYLFEGESSYLLSALTINKGLNRLEREVAIEEKKYMMEGDMDSLVVRSTSELAYIFQGNTFKITPKVYLNIAKIYMDDSSENSKKSSGKAYELRVEGENSYSVEGGSGIEGEKLLYSREDFSLILKLSGNYYHEFGTPYEDMGGELTSFDWKYEIEGAETERNYYTFSGELVIDYGSTTLTPGITYLAGDETDSQLALGVRLTHHF